MKNCSFIGIFYEMKSRRSGASLGALATQAVVALVGVDAVVSFYKDLGSTNKESAYKKNFKLESTQLITVLQGYIDSIRSKKEWSLPTLETKYKEAIAKG